MIVRSSPVRSGSGSGSRRRGRTTSSSVGTCHSSAALTAAGIPKARFRPGRSRWPGPAGADPPRGARRRLPVPEAFDPDLRAPPVYANTSRMEVLTRASTSRGREVPPPEVTPSSGRSRDRLPSGAPGSRISRSPGPSVSRVSGRRTRIAGPTRDRSGGRSPRSEGGCRSAASRWRSRPCSDEPSRAPTPHSG